MSNEPLHADGGPAFPFNVDGSAHATMFGMSMRDWFAGQALAGLTANSIPGAHRTPHEMVREAFELADLMLQARKAMTASQ